MHRLGFAITVLTILQATTFSQTTYKDAKDEASRYLERKFLFKCGKDVFTKHEARGSLTGTHSIEVYEFKDFRWSLKAAPVTVAERLNGVVWKGQIVVKTSAYRVFTSISSHNQGYGNVEPYWAMWNDGRNQIIIEVLKRHGAWEQNPKLTNWITSPLEKLQRVRKYKH